MAHFKIGTRGSKLALWQAEFVSTKLQEHGHSTEICIITTKGDQILDTSLAKIGSKGVFTEEIENQLLNKNIDIAVHSAKDVQTDLGEQLEIIAFGEREQYNDVLVSERFDASILEKKGAKIGTSSTRRKALLKRYYPHIEVVDIRGNLQTRLQKLKEGIADAIILAYAGVHRMGYNDKIIHHFDVKEFVPPVGQGAIAIECAVFLEEDKKNSIKNLISHKETYKCISSERAFLKTISGGCSIPSFCLSKIENGEMMIRAGIIGLDGQEMIIDQIEGDPDCGVYLGIELAQRILLKGGKALLEKIKLELK